MTELPPGPRTPAAINSARFARQPIESLLGWHQRYGDLFTVKFLIFGTGVFVADPAAIRELFTGDQSDLLAGEVNAPLAPVLGGNSVLVLDGPRHLRQRKLLLPPFQGSAVHAFREVIREVAESEVAGWSVGSKFALQSRMRTLTFEVICRAVFGVTERQRVERLRAALLPVIETGAATFFLPQVLRRDLGPLSPWGRLQRRLRRADDLLYEEIERRRHAADLDQRSDVLSLLLRARDEEGKPMTDEELRDELMTMLAAGHETTATGLAFAFDLLLRHPEVLSRLRDELASGDDAYLRATVTESLRLRPVIDAPGRLLTEPRTLGDYELPAGINVYPAIVLVHRRSDLYPEPGQFRPERFLDEEVESYGWLPFGGGIRRCIGAALAQAEMAEVLRVVLSRVELKPVDPEPERVVLQGITLVPKHGTRVAVVGAA